MEPKFKKELNKAENIEFFNVAMSLLAHFPERAQNIFKQRFGLADNFSVQTLDKIGNDHKVTRERVRQIITDYKKHIAKKCDEAEFREIENIFIFTIEDNCGIVKEDNAVSHLNQKKLAREENALRFLVNHSKRIHVVFEKTIIERSWVISKEILGQAKMVIAEAENILKKEKKTLTSDEIFKKLSVIFPNCSKKLILNFLESSIKVKSNQFKKWGLHDWPEINPRGSREKIYLILKEEGSPLHFTQITKLIDKHKLGAKKAHPQTIHNELIKDDRFVLIGRGIYALSEWGYYKGAIKDVLKNILEKNGKPIRQDDIMQEVLKLRKVKKATIAINLNNAKLFNRKGEWYSLKR
ncbi:MAG: HTH domain-containing protein [Candidatus Moraniibacteriota bacterium]